METDPMLESPISLHTVKEGQWREEKEKKIVREDGIAASSNLINFVCGMIGPGCFSVAMSFKQAGLWNGLMLMFLMGGLSLVSMYKIIECSQFLAKITGDKFLDYGDMAKEACKFSFPRVRKYANLVKWIVNGSLIAFQLGVISVTLVFAAEHILEIIDFFYGSTHGLTKLHVILIYFIPQLLLNFIGNIRIITFLSLCGNIIIFAAAILITKELVLHDKYKSYELPSFTTLEETALAAGALIYAFEGQAMVLPLENKLKHPEDMIGINGVLCTAMNLVICIFAFLGFFGYLTFGPDVQGSLTLNLSNNYVSIIVKMLLVAKVFVGSALQLYVIVAMLWPPFNKKYFKQEGIPAFLGDCATRIFLMVVALLVAVCIPNLNNIIPFVGITSGMMLSFIIPATLDTLVFLPRFRAHAISRSEIVSKLLMNSLLFIIGWFFMILGLYVNISGSSARDKS